MKGDSFTGLNLPGHQILGLTRRERKRAARKPDSTLGAAGLPPEGRTSDNGTGPPVATAVWGSLGQLIAPVTLLTALAFFFGWTRTDAIFAYFGVSSTVLGYNTQDYLLRSVDGFFTPLVVLVVTALAFISLHSVVRRLLYGSRHLIALRLLPWILGLIGASLLVFGLLSAIGRQPFNVHYLLAPASPGLGAALLSYALVVSQWLTSTSKDGNPESNVNWLSFSIATLMTVLIVLSLFWVVATYARQLGTQRAEAIAAGLTYQPDVIVYSKEGLNITEVGGGVVDSAVVNSDSKFHHRYSGLKLLTKTDGKYFLLPVRWTHNLGTVIVVPDSGDILMEYVIHRP